MKRPLSRKRQRSTKPLSTLSNEFSPAKTGGGNNPGSNAPALHRRRASLPLADPHGTPTRRLRVTRPTVQRDNRTDPTTGGKWPKTFDYTGTLVLEALEMSCQEAISLKPIKSIMLASAGNRTRSET